MTPEPFLVIKGLSSAYVTRPWGVFGKKEVKPVLDHVDLEIGRGEIFGLVGESGCGKTTLAKCVLGLIDYQGEVIINGRRREKKSSPKSRKERALEVQAVFQNPGGCLNPAKTIGWILEEPLRAHGLGSSAERQTRVDQMLDLVGLDASYKTRKPREISSGQKQRVAIGAALMLSPGLIVADEPVSALDVSVAAQILNLFRSLNKQLNLSLLFISHNMELVSYLCDRVAVMRGGRVSDGGASLSPGLRQP
ncbi:MAG: dipeptide/oligopeptide/nickel ABC transporter ATP-binding protein [Treponema sp.]|nr:dipeptide/oligopeptide/nickel ABC transporter ATP-binding protein [Treponema sp.]